MKYLPLILLLSACAFNSTTSQVRPGTYTITSSESDAGGSANALDWEINHQGDELCPRGFDQVAQRKERAPGSVTYITTVVCR